MSDGSSKQPRPIAPLAIKQSKHWGIPGALVFGILSFMIPEVVLATVGGSLAVLSLSDNEKNFTGIVIYEMLVIGMVGLIVAAYGKTFRDLGLGTFKFDYIWRALLAFALYLPLSYIISLVVGLLFSYDKEQVQPLGFTNPVGIEATLIFIGLVLLVPLAEELLFRGFIFSGFRKRLSVMWTSILVSILFALVHGQVNVALDVFALSLMLCYLRESTGSLWPAFLLHATKNGIAVALLLTTGFTG